MSNRAEAKSYDRYIFELRSHNFVLWTGTKITTAPVLVLSKLLTKANSTDEQFEFRSLLRKQLTQADPTGSDSIWTLPVEDLGADLDKALSTNETSRLACPASVYHYWFEVENTAPESSASKILVTDPFATAVDYRVRQHPDGINQPASVTKLDVNKKLLLPCDPSGTELHAIEAPPNAEEVLPKNSNLVIYELPTSWTSGDDGGTDNGTFSDVLALLKEDHAGERFASVEIVQKRAVLAELGVNTIELLPPTDAKARFEWGYAPAHYFAPDYDLGGTDHNASTDFARLAQYCNQKGIRLINDTVMAFSYDPYTYINFEAFHWPVKYKVDVNGNHDRAWEAANNPDAEAWQSSRNPGEVREDYGGKVWRYDTLSRSYNLFDGEKADNLSSARVFHKAHLAWWMSRFHLEGFRLDSVNNVANWDFVREFRADAYKHFHSLYPGLVGPSQYFIVIGEELNMPISMVKDSPGKDRPLDAIWNEEFRKRIRAVVVGESWGEDGGSDKEKFEWTVRKMVDCTQLNLWDFQTHFDHGGQAINYITSHDTEGNRQERMWNYLDNVNVKDDEGKAQRCKLAFACLLTSIGMPMILAGEEFCDKGDKPFKHPYKQEDPVNWARLNDTWRTDLFEFVKHLIALRKASPALTNLAAGSVDFIWSHPSDGRVQAWVRRSALSDHDDMIAVVANCSDTPYQNGYNIRTWPSPPNGKHWHDAITDARADDAGQQSLVAWDVKVYKLADD